VTNRTKGDTSRRTLLSGATAAGVSLLVLPSAAAAASVAPTGTTPAPEPTADFEPDVTFQNTGTQNNERVAIYMGWGESYARNTFFPGNVTSVTSKPIDFDYELVVANPSATFTGSSNSGYAELTGTRVVVGASYTLTLTSRAGDHADAGVVRSYTRTR